MAALTRRTLDLVDDEDRIAQRRPQGRDLQQLEDLQQFERRLLASDDGHDKLPGDGHEAARWRT